MGCHHPPGSGRNSRTRCCDGKKKQGPQQCLQYDLFWGRQVGEYGFPHVFKNKQWKDKLKNDQMVALGGSVVGKIMASQRCLCPKSPDPMNKWLCMTKGTSEDVIKVQDFDCGDYLLKAENLRWQWAESRTQRRVREMQCCWLCRQRKKAKECGPLLEARNSKGDGLSPRASRKEHASTAPDFGSVWPLAD